MLNFLDFLFRQYIFLFFYTEHALKIPPKIFPTQKVSHISIFNVESLSLNHTFS